MNMSYIPRRTFPSRFGKLIDFWNGKIVRSAFFKWINPALDLRYFSLIYCNITVKCCVKNPFSYFIKAKFFLHFKIVFQWKVLVNKISTKMQFLWKVHSFKPIFQTVLCFRFLLIFINQQHIIEIQMILFPFQTVQGMIVL